MELHLVHVGLEAVEHDQLAALELIVHQLAHVIIIGKEGACVGKHELLIHHPALRHRRIEHVQHPHAVVLHDHALSPRLAEPLFKVFRRQLALIFDDMDVYALVGELIRGVFLLAFLADEKHRALAVAEALVLQRFLYEFCLAGFQKARKEIYGNVFSITQCSNSSFNACSLSLEPITQKRPVTAAPPRRISTSPGT